MSSLHTPTADVSGAQDLLAHRALSISNVDGCLYAVMVGMSESLLGAMAVELGHRDTELALILLLPMLIGSAAQLCAGPLTALLGARKRLVVLGASLQALSVLGLYFIASHGERALYPLLVASSCYFVCAMVVGPPWGSWMAALTEGRQRERYFARRSAMVQLSLVVAFCTAGAVLHTAGQDPEAKLRAFAMLHLVGFGFRALSALMLALQPDVKAEPRSARQSIAAIRTAATTADFRVAGFLGLLNLSAHIAAPFFTPYMLQDLQLSYAVYVGLTAIPIVVKAIFLPFLHPLSVRFGMRSLLLWSGAVSVILPASWAVFSDMPELILVQVISGLAWGTIEFTSYQLFLSSARADCRVEFLSLATTISSGAQLAGGLTGGYLRTDHGYAYHTLFLLSSVGRALSVAWMADALPMRLGRDLPKLFLRVISVRPGLGTVQRPIIADEPGDADEATTEERDPKSAA